MKKPDLPWHCLPLLFAAAAFGLAGCTSSAPIPRDLMAEEARSGGQDVPVAMKGEALFDQGQLQVVATVARGFRREPDKNGMKHVPKERKRWFQHNTDAFSEDYSFDYGDSEEEQKEAVQAYIRQAMARRAAGSPMPPVTLEVVFENRSNQPMEIVPTDVDSDLGNFAVRPPKLTIPAGGKATLDPMVSQLGVTSDVIPLTVAVTIGGKSETHVIEVKNILAPSVRALTEAPPPPKS